MDRKALEQESLHDLRGNSTMESHGLEAAWYPEHHELWGGGGVITFVSLEGIVHFINAHTMIR